VGGSERLCCADAQRTKVFKLQPLETVTTVKNITAQAFFLVFFLFSEPESPQFELRAPLVVAVLFDLFGAKRFSDDGSGDSTQRRDHFGIVLWKIKVEQRAEVVICDSKVCCKVCSEVDAFFQREEQDTISLQQSPGSLWSACARGYTQLGETSSLKPKKEGFGELQVVYHYVHTSAKKDARVSECSRITNAVRKPTIRRHQHSSFMHTVSILVTPGPRG
jgi:hypothetical protein